MKARDPQDCVPLRLTQSSLMLTITDEISSFASVQHGHYCLTSFFQRCESSSSCRQGSCSLRTEYGSFFQTSQGVAELVNLHMLTSFLSDFESKE